MQRLTVTTIAVTENNQPACDWRRFPVKSYWRVEGSAGQAVAWPPKSIARRAGHGIRFGLSGRKCLGQKMSPDSFRRGFGWKLSDEDGKQRVQCVMKQCLERVRFHHRDC